MTRRRHRRGAPSASAGPLTALALGLLEASDPPDLAGWSRLLAENVHLRVGNRQPAVGREASLRELSRLFQVTAALGRGFRELWPSGDGETVLMEIELTPVGSVRPLPVALVVRMIAPEAIVRDVRFYFDPAPLRLDGNGSGGHPNEETAKR